MCDERVLVYMKMEGGGKVEVEVEEPAGVHELDSEEPHLTFTPHPSRAPGHASGTCSPPPQIFIAHPFHVLPTCQLRRQENISNI